MSKARSFFRAVNLESDIEVPDRLSHYQPTTRSLPIIEAVLGRDPTLVIAAYGSGKSLAAGVGALIAINDPRSRDAVKCILPKVQRVDPEAHQRLSQRFAARGQGRAIILSGHIADLAREIGSALGAPEKLSTLERVLNWASANLPSAAHLAIVWDEFGRHLESLVAEGRSRELDFVQRLAEWAARAEAPTASLTLLSHQNLLAYAGGLNQTSRNEWRKIEGRFRTLRFVEDSRELYRLLVDRIGERRESGTPPLDSRLKGAVVQRAMEAGWFDGAADVNEVADLVEGAWPLSAGALQSLPRLAARIGQNERSLFSFVEEVDLSRPVGFEELYRGFSDAMRSDVGAGGAHKRWIETESARAKAESDVEREALAAACLLQLGTDGERRKLSRAALEVAVASRGIPLAEAASAINALIGRKLLLHRCVVDDVSVWHGIDVDVASRLAEERAKRADAFDAVAFLAERRPAPIVRATRHNIEYGTARYLCGRYLLSEEVELQAEGSAPDAAPVGPWGDVLYVLAESEVEIAKARGAALASPRERTLYVIPSRPLRVVDAALEVACLEALRADDNLLAEDPLVSVEIDELLSVARRQLDLAVHRLTSDRPTDAKWYYAGAELPVTGERPATIVASEMMGAWYPKTPLIANDQLMRQRVSKQMNTARVRLLMRMTESAKKPWMGYGRDDTSVEASVYRTVLANTGLHREGPAGLWGFAEPEKVQDPGLKLAWTTAKSFFQEPSAEPKKLSGLVAVLTGPPIGAPSGVIPVIVMAGYQAFARCVSLRSDGAYVADILGFDANRMFADPERHEVEVHEADDGTLLYLDELAYVFAHAKNDEEVEALRFAHDAFAQWWAGLPNGARRSHRLSQGAQALLRAAAEASDPAAFFLRVLPDLFGGGRRDFDAVVAVVEAARDEIDGLVEGYLDEAVRVLGEAFRIGNDNAVQGMQSWVACLDVDSLLTRNDLRLTDKAILRVRWERVIS
ncbi:hypothetical protein [Methylobacterium nodulans]|uniref:ATP-binding protein n=1 Tax=Methylobacterium nodulans (strain LMG 21967 / CNCM I-2342 / ORS 2060) TaxID=460265 RepID=B8IDV3_METNO|nr:hypothetical protein [Methylobacterium nodulans]ACL55675.1 hypothetical protein Mnod_0641 [Methylobacterium nodulans ORS 2060]